MTLTLLGIVIDASPEQRKKAASPMLVTASGIVIDVSPEQSEKAASPMRVTVSGIVIDVSPEQPRKAPGWMYCTGQPDSVSGIEMVPTVFWEIAFHLEEYTLGSADEGLPPTDATPFEMENVQTMPSTTSASATADDAKQ